MGNRIETSIERSLDSDRGGAMPYHSASLSVRLIDNGPQFLQAVRRTATIGAGRSPTCCHHLDQVRAFFAELAYGLSHSINPVCFAQPGPGMAASDGECTAAQNQARSRRDSFGDRIPQAERQSPFGPQINHGGDARAQRQRGVSGSDEQHQFIR